MPPAVERIDNFVGNRIAFYKPRKHTYYLMAWAHVARYWVSSQLNPVPALISKHKTRTHRNSVVTIRISNGRNMEISSACEYLRIGNENIAIVKRVGGATMPTSFSRIDFIGGVAGADYLRDDNLWSLVVEAPAAAPLSAAPVVVPVVVGTRALLDPLPKRIAWLIAEDASKNNETCSIALDPISPLTAAVTTCFHCFDNDSITIWMATHNTCPQCRKKCLVTKAFDG
jgi:hypothetical protein